MLSKSEIKKWLLENCVDGRGNLDLSNLDLTDFDGCVLTCGMRVKKSLYQDAQEVGGALYQSNQRVDQWLYQDNQLVLGNLWQGQQSVGGKKYE